MQLHMNASQSAMKNVWRPKRQMAGQRECKRQQWRKYTEEKKRMARAKTSASNQIKHLVNAWVYLCSLHWHFFVSLFRFFFGFFSSSSCVSVTTISLKRWQIVIAFSRSKHYRNMCIALSSIILLQTISKCLNCLCAMLLLSFTLVSAAFMCMYVCVNMSVNALSR